MEFLGYKYLVVNCYDFNGTSAGIQAQQKKVMQTLLQEKLAIDL